MPVQRLALDASVRSYDADGRMRVASSAISIADVNPYLGSEMPYAEELGLDPDRIYKMLRHPDELRKAAASFNGVPILLKHEVVSAADPKKDIVVGSAGTNTTFDGTYLMNSLSIWDQEAIDLIESGEQRELSCGYRFVPDMTPGFFAGKRYDGVMRNLVANHIALVAKGRAGPNVVVGDEALRRRKVIQMRKIARDASPDWSRVTDYLKGLGLSDDELAELSNLFANSASETDTAQTQTAAEGIGAVEAARKDTDSMGVSGAMDHTLKSAAAVYRGALTRMGIAMDNWPAHMHMPAAAARIIFQSEVKKLRGSGQPLLRPTAAGMQSFSERFPHAAKIGVGASGPRRIPVKF